MPYRSEAQRRFFFWAAKHHKDGITEEMAHEWAEATPKGKKLPEHVKKAEFAPGIKHKQISPLPHVSEPELWEFSAHPHDADRAGLHIDLRLGNKASGIAHSFVVPEAKMPEPGKAVRVVPTFDHCFPPGTQIATPTGNKAIESIKAGDVVWSLAADGTRAARTVLGTMQHPASVDGSELVWLTPRLGKTGGMVLCTPGHQIYTASGKVQAADLSATSQPIIMGERFSEDQLAVIMGTALGDGGIYKNDGLVVRHGPKQKQYAEYKASLLGRAIKPMGNCFGFGVSCPEIQALRKELYRNNKKRISRQWLDRMGPRGLAIYFCDDGSCSFKRNRFTIELATQCFPKADVIRLQQWLLEAFQICSRRLKARRDSRFGGDHSIIRGRYRLRIDHKSSAKRFLSVVAPFVPQSMAYKIPAPEAAALSLCLSCGCSVSKGRKYCSGCLWNDARRYQPWRYAQASDVLVTSHAIYQRFGKWPVGEFSGEEDNLGSFLRRLDRHSKERCKPSYVGGISGRLRRAPCKLSYTGPVYNLTVEGEHNYVLSCGLVVGNSIPYMDRHSFVIDDGYGKGKVLKGRRTQAEVHFATPTTSDGTKLRFNLYDGDHPQEFSIRRDKGGWWLHNKTLTRLRRPEIPSSKPDYKETSIDALDPQGAETWLPKLDGAHSLIHLEAEKTPRVFSYRVGKNSSTGLIEHTHKIPGLMALKVPKSLDGTILRGETIALDKDNKALPAQTVGGLLNAKVLESRKKQEALGVELKTFPFSVERFKGKDVSQLSFGEKQTILKQVHEALPVLGKLTSARQPEDKRTLLEAVKNKEHPLTEEGVVLVHEEARPEQFTKAKIAPDFDVVVRKVHPAKKEGGGLHDRAGAISYSWTKDGPIVGQVGGFKHEEARDMLAHPSRYVGRTAKVTATKKFEGGALFQPRFKEWHMDKNEATKEAMRRGFFDELAQMEKTKSAGMIGSGLKNVLGKVPAMGKMMASPNAERALDLAGLGVLAVPAVHGMMKEKDPTSRAMHGVELGGLGVLAAHPAYELGKHLLGR